MIFDKIIIIEKQIQELYILLSYLDINHQLNNSNYEQVKDQLLSLKAEERKELNLLKPEFIRCRKYSDIFSIFINNKYQINPDIILFTKRLYNYYHNRYFREFNHLLYQEHINVNKIINSEIKSKIREYDIIYHIYYLRNLDYYQNSIEDQNYCNDIILSKYHYLHENIYLEDVLFNKQPFDLNRFDNLSYATLSEDYVSSYIAFKNINIMIKSCKIIKKENEFSGLVDLFATLRTCLRLSNEEIINDFKDSLLHEVFNNNLDEFNDFDNRVINKLLIDIKNDKVYHK